MRVIIYLFFLFILKKGLFFVELHMVVPEVKKKTELQWFGSVVSLGPANDTEPLRNGVNLSPTGVTTYTTDRGGLLGEEKPKKHKSYYFL